MKKKKFINLMPVIFILLCCSCRRNLDAVVIASISLGNQSVDVIRYAESSYELEAVVDESKKSVISLNNLLGENNLSDELFADLVVTKYTWFYHPLLCIGVPVSEELTRYAFVYFANGDLRRIDVQGYGENGFIYSLDQHTSTAFPELVRPSGIEVGMPLAEGGSAVASYRWDPANKRLVYEANEDPVISELIVDGFTIGVRQTQYQKPDGPWNESFALAFPESYAGQFELVSRNDNGIEVSRMALCEVFNNRQSFSGGPPLLIARDYNGDGRMDFSLGIDNRYAIFSVDEAGKILRLPVEDSETDGYILSYTESMQPLPIREGAVLGQLSGEVGRIPSPVEYRWNGQSFVRDNSRNSDKE
ncbi:MAG: hypothetical protein IKX20_11650 [Paludibacteraceae bacterium]|nr:hypothetical protein [Paludibacteraceae bacterium]